MIERIKKNLEELDAIYKEVSKIIGYPVGSPITLDGIDREWSLQGTELRMSVEDCSIDEDCYLLTVSSLGCLGKKLYVGEEAGYTYVMAYDDDWRDTCIYVLDNKKKIA